jgi:branched-chain amino acid transport system permease protein
VFGAATMIFLQEYISEFTEYWMLVVGSLFILFVIFVPGGIAGFVRDRLSQYGIMGSSR